MTKQLNILVSGAGIGGPVLAYWLHKAGHKVTVVERDAQLRTTGQSVDIREAAVEVIRQMGLESKIKDTSTHEAGVAFVDPKDKVRALFKATGSTEVQSFTSEFEVFRGDLAKIFFETTKDKATYVWGEYITSIDQDDNGAYVEFADGKDAARYDLVIAADGLGSKVRAMVFNTSTREHIWSLDTFAAYFTINKDLLNGDQYSRWYNAPGGRCILLRPDPQRRTRAHLFVINHGDQAQLDTYRAAYQRGMPAVKELFTEEFKDAGWLTPEILASAPDAKDFYGSEIAQIRTETLYKGRVALVGDAGYCPTPFTGMGTSLAIIGAYVLAGEISKDAEDVTGALQRYEGIMHPYARKIQQFPRSMPKLANPMSAWGIKVQLAILGLVSWLKVDVFANWLQGFSIFQGQKWKLPEYRWVDSGAAQTVG
ncbi:ubiquinone biosynthesis monooxygenase COQ6 [Elsinoe australis]|uniref:Ubiquinone biosynthesis monooxygenase COQ6 n=1 Tax=Elsinoe australis TaxID=40998 RepID=A0A2P8A8R9_9PEZI|nr:ubiquinone biosynthesis monooxygenase COQ6 [Elsinoe australis]